MKAHDTVKAHGKKRLILNLQSPVMQKCLFFLASHNGMKHLGSLYLYTINTNCVVELTDVDMATHDATDADNVTARFYSRNGLLCKMLNNCCYYGMA